MKVVAIVQARMSSTRLPGKVLMGISRKPMLEHVIDRLKRAKTLSEIVVATSVNERDEPIIELSKRLCVGFFVGSEEDVLDRFLKAAEQARADTIVRVTADCPLIDPYIVDHIVSYHFRENMDCTRNLIDEANPKSFPRGLDTEVFNMDVLKRCHELANKTYHREHVTPFIYEHPELFKVAVLEAPENYRRPNYRLTVDTRDDLQLIREIYCQLYVRGEIINMKSVIELLDKHPELPRINAHVQQKQLKRLGMDL